MVERWVFLYFSFFIYLLFYVHWCLFCCFCCFCWVFLGEDCVFVFCLQVCEGVRFWKTNLGPLEERTVSVLNHWTISLAPSLCFSTHIESQKKFPWCVREHEVFQLLQQKSQSYPSMATYAYIPSPQVAKPERPDFVINLSNIAKLSPESTSTAGTNSYNIASGLWWGHCSTLITDICSWHCLMLGFIAAHRMGLKSTSL